MSAVGSVVRQVCLLEPTLYLEDGRSLLVWTNLWSWIFWKTQVKAYYKKVRKNYIVAAFKLLRFSSLYPNAYLVQRVVHWSWHC